MIYKEPSIYNQGLNKEDIENLLTNWEYADFEIISSKVEDYQYFSVLKNTSLKLLQLNIYFTVYFSSITSNSWSEGLIRIKNIKVLDFVAFANKLTGATPDNSICQIGMYNNPSSEITVYKTSESGSKSVVLNSIIVRYEDV